MQTRVNVILPEHLHNPSLLMLLHGLGDDENTWLQQVRLVPYLSNKQIVIVMPRVDRSYYANTQAGVKYFDYISNELLSRIHEWFNLDADADSTFVAGQSMGGYGALKVILNRPNCFKAAFVLSGVTDLLLQWKNHPERDKWYHELFGNQDKLRGSNSDLPFLIKHWLSIDKPIIRQICGKQDPFYKMNQDFQEAATEAGFDCKLKTVQGAHQWSVWNCAIQLVLQAIEEMK